MRKRLTWILALGAAIAVATAGIAMASKAVEVRLGNLILTIKAEVTPHALSKTKLSPITLKVGGGIRTVDGTHPPAVKEVIVDTDKNGTVNAKGLPACTAGKLQATETKVAEKNCKESIVGEGEANAEVAFPEQAPINVKSKLLAFNGGVAGGTTTMYIHAFFSSPVNGALVTTIKIKKEHKGRYGLRSVATIPPLAGGNGSITSFNLTFHRLFTYKGKKQSYFLAKCADGKFFGQAESVFKTGERIKGSVVVPCTSKG